MLKCTSPSYITVKIMPQFFVSTKKITISILIGNTKLLFSLSSTHSHHHLPCHHPQLFQTVPVLHLYSQSLDLFPTLTIYISLNELRQSDLLNTDEILWPMTKIHILMYQILDNFTFLFPVWGRGRGCVLFTMFWIPAFLPTYKAIASTSTYILFSIFSHI